MAKTNVRQGIVNAIELRLYEEEMKKGKGKKKLIHNRSMGEILMQSLTTDQIARFLDVVFAAGDVSQYVNGFKKADPDMAQTIERVLKMNSGEVQRPRVPRVASNQRILEHWNSLWDRWQDIGFDVGDEKSKYAVQDAHWEAPYFDGYALSDDLEEIAADMLRSIDSVFDLVKKPGIFHAAMEEIDSNISSYSETSLLLAERSYYHSDDEKEIAELLRLWGKVSEQMGNINRSSASKLQSITYRSPEDWNAVLREYKNIMEPKVKGVTVNLFGQWKSEMARRSTCNELDNKILSNTWIHWLIETELEGKTKREWFVRKLNVWLDHLKKDGKVFEQQWPLLTRLTKDLPGSASLRKPYPTFFEVILSADSGSSQLDRARCKGLKKMDAGACLLRAIAIWKIHLGCLVPDLGKSYKSNYEEHARWMRALYELSRDEYESLLSQWRVSHKQRRNLWRDMKKWQLPT